jgi:hypothetical protein
VPVLSVLFVGGFASALYNIFQTTNEKRPLAMDNESMQRGQGRFTAICRRCAARSLRSTVGPLNATCFALGKAECRTPGSGG